jgi:hypothetical protein
VTLTILGDVLTHVTVLVISPVCLSVKWPVATNCCVVPKGNDELVELTSIVKSAAGETVSVAAPWIAPTVAVTVAAPTAFEVASPNALIVTTPDGELLQCTDLDRSWLLPSVNFPFAVN